MLVKKDSIKREHYQSAVGRSPFLYAGFACNNNCIFCFEKDLPFFDKGLAGLKKEIKAIRENFEIINLMGREPTLRKDLVKLVVYAKRLEFKQIGITTNGRMLAYPGLAKKLISAGLNQAVVTVAGHNDKIHDWHTQAKGSFKQTLTGIKNILAQSPKDFSLVINIMVTNKNLKQLDKIIDFYVRLGVKEINIGHILPFNKEIINSRSVVAKMTEVVPYLIEAQNKHGQNIKLLFVEYPPCVFPKQYRHLSFPCLEESPQKEHFKLCKKCSHKSRCDGVHQYYLNLYGEAEFRL